MEDSNNKLNNSNSNRILIKFSKIMFSNFNRLIRLLKIIKKSICSHLSKFNKNQGLMLLILA